VTLELVHAFAEAPRAEQVEALGELRRRVEDDSTVIELGFASLALGALLALAGPSNVLPEATNLVAGILIGAIGGLATVVTVSPALISIARRSNRRDAAAAWLTAYEDELSHRRAARGRAARRWLRTH